TIVTWSKFEIIGRHHSPFAPRAWAPGGHWRRRLKPSSTPPARVGTSHPMPNRSLAWRVSSFALALTLPTAFAAGCGSSSSGDAVATDGGAGGGDDAATTANCGTGGGMRGLSSRSVMVGSKKRTYLVYLPQSLDPKKPVPLVFVFHGATMSGQAMYDITGYSKLADSEGF